LPFPQAHRAASLSPPGKTKRTLRDASKYERIKKGCLLHESVTKKDRAPVIWAAQVRPKKLDHPGCHKGATHGSSHLVSGSSEHHRHLS
jgi:hypothetical protein